MTTDAVRRTLASRRPFKVITADGRTIQVPHPEFAAMSPSGRLLFVATEGDNLETIDLLLVVSLQEEKVLPT